MRMDWHSMRREHALLRQRYGRHDHRLPLTHHRIERLPMIRVTIRLGLRALVALALCIAASTGPAACGGSITAATDGGVSSDADREASRNDASRATDTQWVDFCVAAAACELPYFGLPPLTNLVTQCLGDELDNGGSAWADLACFVTAGASCPRVRACNNAGNSSATCQVEAGVVVCEGEVAESCYPEGLPYVVDCSEMYGETCVPGQGCTTGPCDLPVHSYCQGTEILTCANGDETDGGYAYVTEDCADEGNSTCIPSPDGGYWPLCKGPGPACTNDRCDGTTLVRCLAGHEARYDCPLFGLGCFTDKDPDTDLEESAFCGLGTECGYDYPDSCEGNVLRFCNAGKVATLDCVAAGWKGCVSDSGGTRCAP